MTLHPLVRRLIDSHAARAITPDELPGWRDGPGSRALFFAGDPVRFPEALDVAVVLPELRAASGRDFDIGVVPREHEDALARLFGVQRWPSIVFLRGGSYQATISGMQDWTDFVAAVGRALDAPPTRAPGIGIPVVAAAAGGCH
jgi:hydrogenase-1 operon protein HyaE